LLDRSGQGGRVGAGLPLAQPEHAFLGQAGQPSIVVRQVRGEARDRQPEQEGDPGPVRIVSSGMVLPQALYRLEEAVVRALVRRHRLSLLPFSF
jgi:hypothetical protein